MSLGKIPADYLKIANEKLKITKEILKHNRQLTYKNSYTCPRFFAEGGVPLAQSFATNPFNHTWITVSTQAPTQFRSIAVQEAEFLHKSHALLQMPLVNRLENVVTIFRKCA